MSKITDTWNGLDAGKKRTLVLIGVGGLVMFILWGYVKNDPPKREKATHQQPVVKAPLTGSKETSLGVEALAAKLTRLESELKTAKGDSEMSALRTQANLDALKEQFQKREAELKAQLEGTTNELTDLQQSVERSRTLSIGSPSGDKSSGGRPGTAPGPTSLGDNPALIQSEWALFDTDATAVMPAERGTSTRSGDKGAAPAPMTTAPAIKRIGNTAATTAAADADKVEKKVPAEVTIPSGSIISGVLLTGVDAPTGSQSKSTPMPSLLRIKTEGILPNFASWDVTECFVLLSGFGDLSTERYMARAERLSCVSDQKQVLDLELEAYAAGEDGKAGIRGRLVTRMGQALLNGGIAGFFSGAAQAFAPQRLPTISTNSDDSIYTPSASLVLNTGAGQGASQALNQIAEFYIKLAEQTLPVVEVDAAREVELILVRPLAIPANTTTARRR